MTRTTTAIATVALLAAAAGRAAAPAAVDGERFARGMTVSFSGREALYFRLLSAPLPDRDQGGPVTQLQLGPPLDLWVLGADGNRLAVTDAQLVDPKGLTVPPRSPGHWRSDRPVLGCYELTVAAPGKQWRLWSAFHPVMLRLDKPVTVRVGEAPGAVFLFPSRQRLELAQPGDAVIGDDEEAEWLAFLPWDLFEPSLPHVRIEGRTTLEPGERLSLLAVTSDPDDDVRRVVWQLPDGETVEGARLEREVRRFTTWTVRVAAEDANGATGEAAVEIIPPPLHEAKLPGLVLVQAEDFSGQGEGRVEVTDRGSNVGRMITKWHQAEGHWLEWRLPIGKAGVYALYARYATASHNARRELTIDGKPPGAGGESIAFPRTGGFGRRAREWRTTRLGPSLELSAGQRTLRMTNLGDGLALDYLAVVPLRTGGE